MFGHFSIYTLFNHFLNMWLFLHINYKNETNVEHESANLANLVRACVCVF